MNKNEAMKIIEKNELRLKKQKERSKAASVPPINSTTISTEGFSTTSIRLVVKSSAGVFSSRFFDKSRTAILRISMTTDPCERDSISRPCSSRIFQTPDPTVPNPAKPIPKTEQLTPAF